jgi:hypothetical protein
MEESTMKKHVTFVAALHIGFSIIGIFGAFALFFILRFAGSFVEEVDVANTVLHFIGIFLPFAILTVSIIGLIGGIGLLSYKKWARVLVLIVSGVDCLNIPLGTLVGVYSIWALMQDDSIKLFTD